MWNEQSHFFIRAALSQHTCCLTFTFFPVCVVQKKKARISPRALMSQLQFITTIICCCRPLGTQHIQYSIVYESYVSLYHYPSRHCSSTSALAASIFPCVAKRNHLLQALPAPPLR